MHNWRPSSILPAILALSMTSSSCLFKKSPVAFTPPPPSARSISAKLPKLSEPPLIMGDPTANLPQETISVAELPPPPAHRPPPRRPVVTTAPPKPAAPAQPETAPPAPRLGQLFTPDQEREYNRTLDESLERVKRALAVVSAKPLSPEQSEIANKIRTFQKQAEQAREQDLLTAVTLAKRADVLARDLLERVP